MNIATCCSVATTTTATSAAELLRRTENWRGNWNLTCWRTTTHRLTTDRCAARLARSANRSRRRCHATIYFSWCACDLNVSFKRIVSHYIVANVIDVWKVGSFNIAWSICVRSLTFFGTYIYPGSTTTIILTALILQSSNRTKWTKSTHLTTPTRCIKSTYLTTPTRCIKSTYLTTPTRWTTKTRLTNLTELITAWSTLNTRGATNGSTVLLSAIPTTTSTSISKCISKLSAI